MLTPVDRGCPIGREETQQAGQSLRATAATTASIRHRTPASERIYVKLGFRGGKGLSLIARLIPAAPRIGMEASSKRR